MSKTPPKAAARIKVVPYDVTEEPRAPEEMAAHMDAWLKRAPEDAAGVAKALGELAQARGMSQVARDAGMSREDLYKALGGNGKPSSATLVKIARALSVRPHALKG
jgi:probable addiction module antidote protein